MTFSIWRGRTWSAVIRGLTVLALVAPAVSSPARAEVPATSAAHRGPAVSSPDGRLRLHVSTSGDRLTYGVTRGGRELVQSSALGLRLVDGSTLGSDVTVTGVRIRAHDTTWRPVWGPTRPSATITAS
jgi:alpha-glucosidase